MDIFYCSSQINPEKRQNLYEVQKKASGSNIYSVQQTMKQTEQKRGRMYSKKICLVVNYFLYDFMLT